MRARRTGLLLVAALALAVGCVDAVEEVDPRAESPRFFSLSAFVASQDSLLAGRGLTKTVTVDGASETRRADAVDWAEELAPFAQSDIDRPALWDRYRVDSAATDGGRAVTYTALGEEAFTRRIRVERDGGGAVVRIEIDNGFESVVVDTEQRLEWAPGRYRVYSRQAPELVGGRELEIVGEW